MPSMEMWMGLETVIQSESKAERQKIIEYHLYVESRKMVQMTLSAKQKIETEV